MVAIGRWYGCEHTTVMRGIRRVSRYKVMGFEAMKTWGEVEADSAEKAIAAFKAGKAENVDSDPIGYIWPERWEATKQ